MVHGKTVRGRKRNKKWGVRENGEIEEWGERKGESKRERRLIEEE